MALSATAWLNALNLTWSPAAGAAAGTAAHRDAIDHRLRGELGTGGMTDIGSLPHGTGVSRYSHVDSLVVLPGAKPASHWTALERVRESLQQRWPDLRIEVRQPAVVCWFDDGPIEVVPGYAHDRGFWIADPVGEWMTTYPQEQHGWVDRVDAEHIGGAKALTRQLKVWKYQRHVPISSSYLEMAAAKHLAGRTGYRPVLDLALVLERLHEHQLEPIKDPTGAGSPFTAYSSVAKHAEALSKLATAQSRAAKARERHDAEDEEGAVAQLRLLFDHDR